jgi:hypothetical protein
MTVEVIAIVGVAFAAATMAALLHESELTFCTARTSKDRIGAALCS